VLNQEWTSEELVRAESDKSTEEDEMRELSEVGRAGSRKRRGPARTCVYPASSTLPANVCERLTAATVWRSCCCCATTSSADGRSATPDTVWLRLMLADGGAARAGAVGDLLRGGNGAGCDGGLSRFASRFSSCIERKYRRD